MQGVDPIFDAGDIYGSGPVLPVTLGSPNNLLGSLFGVLLLGQRDVVVNIGLVGSLHISLTMFLDRIR